MNNAKLDSWPLSESESESENQTPRAGEFELDYDFSEKDKVAIEMFRYIDLFNQNKVSNYHYKYTIFDCKFIFAPTKNLIINCATLFKNQDTFLCNLKDAGTDLLKQFTLFALLHEAFETLKKVNFNDMSCNGIRDFCRIYIKASLDQYESVALIIQHVRNLKNYEFASDEEKEFINQKNAVAFSMAQQITYKNKLDAYLNNDPALTSVKLGIIDIIESKEQVLNALILERGEIGIYSALSYIDYQLTTTPELAEGIHYFYHNTFGAYVE